MSAFVWRPWAVAGSFAAAASASFAYLGADFAALFSAESGRQMLEFAGGFFPPDTTPELLRRIARGAAETLAVSAVATLLAAAGGLALALPAAGKGGRLLRFFVRLALNVLRSIPELVWAVFMVLAAGLGPFAGCLALAAHTAGVLGRLFAEALENAPSAPAQALREAGSGASSAFLYGTLPVVLPQLVSYALYRWEHNIRMAAVLGFVGAGGLGQLLYVALSLFKTAEAATVLLSMMGLVAAVDLASGWLRRAITR